MNKPYKGIFFLLLLLLSCEKETTFDVPTVFTGEVTNIEQTKAILSARISNPENIPVIESGFIWGVHSHDNNDIRLVNTTSENEFSFQTNYELLPGKTYYARAFVKTNGYTTYGREVSFATSSAPINLGNWTKIIDDDNNSIYDIIKTGFTHKSVTYLIFESGDIYSLNHITNEIKFFMSLNYSGFISFCVKYNDNAYIFIENAFYKLDLNTFEISKLSEWGNGERFGCSGFIIGNDIYTCLGASNFSDYSKQVWKYNIPKDTWEKLSDFPGDYRGDAFTFTVNGTSYLGGGFNLMDGHWTYPKFTDLWSFDPETNEWQKKENLPIDNRENLQLPGANTSDFGYCYYNNSLYEYNPTFNLWEEMKKLNEATIYYYPYLFSLDNKIFIIESHQYAGELYTFKLWMYEK